MLRQLMRTLTLLTGMIASSLQAVEIINNSNKQISVAHFIFCALYEGAYIGESRIDPNDSYEIENIAGCIVTYKNYETAFIKLQNYHTITITDTQNIISSEIPNEKPEYRTQEVSISEFKKYAKNLRRN